MVLIVVAIAVVVYILTAVFMKKEQVRRLWFIAFFLLIIATACSVVFMQFDKDSLLASLNKVDISGNLGKIDAEPLVDLLLSK